MRLIALAALALSACTTAPRAAPDVSCPEPRMVCSDLRAVPAGEDKDGAAILVPVCMTWQADPERPAVCIHA